MAIGRKRETPRDDTTETTEVVEDRIPNTTDPATQQVEVRRQRALEEMVPEIMGGGSEYDEDALREGITWDYFVHLMGADEIVDAGQVLGDGFTLIDDKNRLVGVPLMFLEWKFRPGDFALPYVSCRVVAQIQGVGVGKFIFNDGSTGIADQLATYTKKTGRQGRLYAKQGLRRSNYTVQLPDPRNPGQFIDSPATTYYIDTATA